MSNLPKRALQRIIGGTRFTFSIWLKSRNFKGDKNYDLNSVVRGFAQCREEKQDDSIILNRICVAYNKAKEVQRKMSPVYSPSNEWLPIYEKPLKEVIDALTKSDVEKLGAMYSNFFRDPCSTGLVGLHVNMKKSFFGRRISLRRKMLWLNDVLYRHKLWRGFLGSTHSLEDLKSPLIGNPFGYYIDGKFIVQGSDYQHYYATLISRLIKDTKMLKCVVELGAGYGAMAYFLLRDNSNISYIDLDLPENSALTAYYLLKAFPERKISLYGEIDLIQNSIRNNEVLIMPSFVINQLPSGCAGLGFNSYSLAEMSRETIDTYISEFSRLVNDGGYFLHVNHNKNSVVIADDFGLDSKQFDLLYKIPALWNMGETSGMDECEYLCRKVGDNI